MRLNLLIVRLLCFWIYNYYYHSNYKQHDWNYSPSDHHQIIFMCTWRWHITLPWQCPKPEIPCKFSFKKGKCNFPFLRYTRDSELIMRYLVQIIKPWEKNMSTCYSWRISLLCFTSITCDFLWKTQLSQLYLYIIYSLINVNVILTLIALGSAFLNLQKQNTLTTSKGVLHS